MIIFLGIVSLLLLAFMLHAVTGHRLGKFTPMFAFMIFAIFPLIISAATGFLLKQSLGNEAEGHFSASWLIATIMVVAGYQLGKRCYRSSQYRRRLPFMAITTSSMAAIAAILSFAYITLS